MNVAKIKNATRMTVSSLATYSSLEMASADRPVPTVTHVDLAMIELPGNKSSKAVARDSGEGSVQSACSACQKVSIKSAARVLTVGVEACTTAGQEGRNECA